MTKTTRTTGHIVVEVSNGTGGTYQHVEPATFFPTGLAVHRAASGRGFNVTHVRSGCHLRAHLAKPVAFRLAETLSFHDWTFAKDAVTAEHARLVREAEAVATARTAA